MKRIYYVSRFSKGLREKDLEEIYAASARNNPPRGINGFLVCLGDTFFQVLEGPDEAVDQLFFAKIRHDPRHRNVVCLKSEPGIEKRLFPDWHMKVFDLNAPGETLPFAFRQMLTALLESHHVIAQYTQPTVLDLLERGMDPTILPPRRIEATVFFSDIIGFSLFSQWLEPDQLVELVDTHIELCAEVITAHGGEVNKVIGDGVLAYFSGEDADPAIEAGVELLAAMTERRDRADPASPVRRLHGGIGLAHGPVYEGNIGFALKRDFTILGNTVNLASRVEAFTRDLEVALILDHDTVGHARRRWEFVSLGLHRLKGQARPSQLFTLDSAERLDLQAIHKAVFEEFGW